MYPIQYTNYFNSIAASINLLSTGEVLLKTSPLIENLPHEKSMTLINTVLNDFYSVRNSPTRPSSRRVDIGNHQCAIWQTNLYGPFFLLSPNHPPREIIIPVVSIHLAIEE